MENTIMLLKIDLNVQKFLFFLTCLSLILIPFVGIMLCVLGAWQMLSAVIVGYILKDKKRGKYFVLSALYLLLMWSMVALSGRVENGLMIIPLAVVFIIIPIFIALWYMTLTSETLKTLKAEDYIYSGREGLEDILDSDELMERRLIMDL